MAKTKRDRPRVFSVGYEALRPGELLALVNALAVVLVDVRSRPSGRVKRGFSRADLEQHLGTRYEWHGKGLGGFGTGPTVDGLARLAADPRRMLLMCSEEAPGDCHRHGIALDLARRGVTVWHVYFDEVVTAIELQRAIDAGDDYAFRELGDVLAEAGR